MVLLVVVVVFFVRIAVVLLVVVVVFFVRIAVILLVVELRSCKGKIFFFFCVNVNRVLETRFTSRCYVKKMPIQTQLEHAKSSLKGSIYRSKIEPLRLEWLVNDIISKLDLLTI